MKLKSGGSLVRMSELARASEVMEAALDDPTKNTRSFLMKYLDGQPLPRYLHDGNWCDDWWSNRIADDTVRKLEMLIGPHGYTIAKVFLIKLQEASQETSK